MKLECHQKISGDRVHIILDNSQENNGQIILGKEDLGSTMWVPLSNISKKMKVSGAESCGCIHDTPNAWAMAIVGDKTAGV